MLFLSFIKTLYTHQRRLFIILISFLTILAITSITNIQFGPFYVWSMYAGPSKPQAHYNFPVITYNDKTLATEPFYRDFHKMHYQYPLYNYQTYYHLDGKDWHAENVKSKLQGQEELVHKIYPSDNDWNNFFEGYSQLLQLKTKSILYQMQVKEVSVKYDEKGYPKVIKETILYEQP